MKFALLASGSKGNCCVIENKDTKVVIDCGTNQKYLKNAFSQIHCEIASLNACLITHTHSDHISALKLFQSLPIYSEEDLGIYSQHMIHEDECFQIKSLKIESIRLSHDVKCLGYILQDEHEKLVYITDTGYLKEQYYEKIQNADYYIFESNHDLSMLIRSKRPEYVKNRIRSANGHLCNEDCARHLRKCIGDKTKQIVLAHISEEANSRELAKKTLEEALKDLNFHPQIHASRQFEIFQGGQDD